MQDKKNDELESVQKVSQAKIKAHAYKKKSFKIYEIKRIHV